MCISVQVERQCVSVSGDIKSTEQQLTQLYQEQGRKEQGHKVSSTGRGHEGTGGDLVLCPPATSQASSES